MSTRVFVRIVASAVAVMVAAGCGPVLYSAADSTVQTVQGFVRSSDLHSHAVRSIKELSIVRLAVMPVIANPGPNNVVTQGGPEAVTAEIYSQVATAGGWDVVPEDDVSRAMQKMPPTTPKDIEQNALKLGHDLSVDGVLYGMVERYKEREGLDYAAASPAAVTFTLKLVDLKSGQVVWSARFSKAQKSLSQNIFDVVNFVQHKARWVRANEIAQEGVRAAVADLHGHLNFAANVKRFETGTYGQLKSGQQRYSTGVQGIY
jgi:TolB-like protein